MLTPTEITKAMKTATAEVVLNDTSEGRGSGGLKLRIRPTASGVTATWLAAWKQGGRRAFKQLGRFPDMTLAQAREAYRAEVAPLLLAGKNPRTAVAAGGRPTVAAMFQGYVDSMRAKGRASAGEVERMLLVAVYNAADAIGRDRLAGTVDGADVAAYVARFFHQGNRGAADKARTYVSAAFGWAMKSANDYTNPNRRDWGVKANPAAAVQRDSGAIGRRDRNLTAEELRTLWHAARPDAPGFSMESAACIRVLIACGQRVMETLRMDGAEIDLQAATWTMPAAKTKGGKRPHTIPLPACVLPTLAQLVERHGAGPLFPGRQGERMHHSSVQQTIDRWNAGRLAHFQTRDLRRTWKSRTADAGVDRFTRDLIQQHAQGDTGSRHYDRADYLPQMRAAMERWDAWLVANVVAENPQEAHHTLAA